MLRLTVITTIAPQDRRVRGGSMESITRRTGSRSRRRRAATFAGTALAAIVLSLTGASAAWARDWSLGQPSLTVAEGVEFSGKLACLDLIEGSFDLSQFEVDIDWGDGTSSAGTVGADFDAFRCSDIEVRGTHTYAAPGTYRLTVRVDDLEDGRWASSVGTATVTSLPNDLGVSIGASPNPVKSGGKLTYTTKVVNSSANRASSVWLTNTLPTGVQFQSLSATPGSCFAPAVGTTGTITCMLGVLGPSAEATMTATVKVVAKGGSVITDSAAVGADDSDPFAANNSAAVTTSVFGRK
jgi:uncharacterized repeat protein (TIGR01451 family)